MWGPNCSEWTCAFYDMRALRYKLFGHDLRLQSCPERKSCASLESTRSGTLCFKYFHFLQISVEEDPSVFRFLYRVDNFLEMLPSFGSYNCIVQALVGLCVNPLVRRKPANWFDARWFDATTLSPLQRWIVCAVVLRPDTATRLVQCIVFNGRVI